MKTLQDHAKEIMFDMQNRTAALQAELAEINTQEAELKEKRMTINAALNAASLAPKRLANYTGAVGPNYECPCCWIKNEIRYALITLPGKDTFDILKCRKCDTEFRVSF